MTTRHRLAAAALCSAAMLAAPGAGTAQGSDGAQRTRVSLGPQLVPRYPGSDEVAVRPYADVSRARGDDEFAFEAPDEAFGFPLLRSDRFAFGPSLGFEGKRRSEDVGGLLPEVGSSFEIGGYAQYQLTQSVRLRLDARQAVSGHDGFIANLGADYVWRDGDRQLFSIGPRLTLTDDRYQTAYFGVRPQDALVAGLPAYDVDGGVQAVGATAGYLRQFSARWGLVGFVKYDRLVGDPADSPLVDRFGSRDQLSGGVALSYTFGRGVR